VRNCEYVLSGEMIARPHAKLDIPVAVSARLSETRQIA